NAPGPNANSFVVREIGACPVTKTLDLEPGQSFRWTATKCPFAPDNTPDTLTFWYQDGQGRQVQCPTTVPLVFNAATSSQFVGAGTLGAVHQLASRRVDVLL